MHDMEIDAMSKNVTVPRYLLFAVLALLPVSQILGQSLINGSFEEPRFTPGVADFQLVDAGSVPGWDTTAGDNLIELWSDGFIVPSFHLDQHAELNANEASTLYQDVAGIPFNSITSFRFAHRGRQGVDTLRLTLTDLGGDGMIGGGNDTVLFTKTYSTDNTAWAVYTSSGEPPIITLGNPVRFAFESVSAAGGNQAVGNLLDDVSFGLATTVPTLSEWGLVAFLMLLATGGILMIRRRSRLAV